MCIVEYVTDCSLDKANSSVVSGGGCPGPPQTEQTMMSPINSPRMVVCFYGLYLFWKIGSQAARQPLSFDSYLQNSKTETISQSLRQSSSDFPPQEFKVECDLSLGQPEKNSRIFSHIALFPAAVNKQIITHHRLIFYIWPVALHSHPGNVYTTSTTPHFLYPRPPILYGHSTKHVPLHNS